MSILDVGLSMIAGASIGFMLIFFLLSEYRRNKLVKAQDIIFSLANKKGFFSKKSSFIRRDEAEVLRLLETVVGNNYYVYPQVHYSELIDVADANKDHDNLYLQLGEKRVDFAVFDKKLLSPKLVVELNGEYHFRKSQQNKDEVRKDLFDSVGIGFVTIPKAVTYSIHGLKDQILPYLVSQPHQVTGAE